ncbi:MAG: glucosidase [Lentisphaeria bacterium]
MAVPANTAAEMPKNDGREQQRLREADEQNVPWRKWGPYLSERQWGTVREDYSTEGCAWDYFTHDQARSRAYRWGEDGLAGISDDRQLLCFALALWNGADPILKERLFGLSNGEGNHGEDVKEYYFYLDNTPTHAYMKYLYKYPQRAYPYDDLVQTNKARSRTEPEYELLDTGVFAEDRYFDVFVEYAKEAPEDIHVRITVCNRGPEAATLHVLPTLWFRNTWSWQKGADKPYLAVTACGKDQCAVVARHPLLGERFLYCQGQPELLFTENETNTERLFGTPNATPYVKDGIGNCVLLGRAGAVNPEHTGTKVSPHYPLTIPAGGSARLRLRLTDAAPATLAARKDTVLADETVEVRGAEADAFWQAVAPPGADADTRNVLRQAGSGMLWTKQFYLFDIPRWIKEHGSGASQAVRRNLRTRNADWFHMSSGDVISMPDKWEYPWFAAWDLAFHAVALSVADVTLAKEQLELMLQHGYMHPSGQLPAYEWNFSDVNPPVHAWAAWFIYLSGKNGEGEGDLQFLERCFGKLLLNFTWWVNRKDRRGANVFEGGFLGLDNIGVFDRSAPLPTGGSLEQADGTAWMCFYCQTMLQIALELAEHNPAYEDMALKFVEHFLWIAAAMDKIGENEDDLWDQEDGFYYDVLRLPDGSASRLKVRSLVGLLPLCASTLLEAETLRKFPKLRDDIAGFLERHPELASNIASPAIPGVAGRTLLSPLDEHKLRSVLAKMLSEDEFLSPHGIRSLSRYHAEHPFVLHVDGQEYRVPYLPAESDTGVFGGNSNWRGPVWFPVNVLIIRGLLNLYAYYGNDFTVECPTGSGKQLNLFEIARELSDRLARIFLRDGQGRRPVYGATDKFQTDPYWRDCILFYEYFHGDNGAGIGASHQTGWTGLVAKTIQLFGRVDPATLLETGAAVTQAPQK